VERTLYRDAALADGRSSQLTLGVSVLVEDAEVTWIRPSDDEPKLDDVGLELVDAGGTTIVPGMVDAHSHLTLPGGSHWIDRGFDPPERLVANAEHNSELLHRAGVRWCRDVGAPTRQDPVDGRTRGLNLGIRDRWRGMTGKPYVRAAGTMVAHKGLLPADLGIDVEDGDQLLEATRRQLDDGADLVKLMLDGPDRGPSPWSVEDIRRVVEEAHARGARVTAHSTELVGARVGVDAGIDSIEHGFELDADVAQRMAANGTFLVTTLAVLRSWRTFARTTRLDRFTSTEGRQAIEQRRETAIDSVRIAHAAEVRIAAGTDFGGGSTRANHMAWEVESLVEAGLEPFEAIAAATWRGGELLGKDGPGTVREGGPADFFLVHGDPLSDPSALWRVWRVAW
jgi:imidazolonepropionase-like amidohydrolase